MICLDSFQLKICDISLLYGTNLIQKNRRTFNKNTR